MKQDVQRNTHANLRAIPSYGAATPCPGLEHEETEISFSDDLGFFEWLADDKHLCDFDAEGNTNFYQKGEDNEIYSFQKYTSQQAGCFAANY